MMNPYMLLGLALAWAASAAGAAWLGYDYANGQHAQDELERRSLAEEVREENRKFADDVAMRVEQAIGGIRIEHRTINRKVEHVKEIHKVLSDPDCAVPADAVRVLNAARGHGEGGGSKDSGPRAGRLAPPMP